MDNYEKSRQKWKELIKKIFGTENITWRLDPENGQIYFSNKGIEQIKATIVFLAMTKTTNGNTKWAWAWAGNNRSLNRIQPINRIMPADISEYLEDGGTFEEPNLFKPECLLLGNTTKGKYYLRYMRAKMMDILGGQFIFEGDINGSNAIFVILKAKKIKQAIPESEVDTPREEEPRESRLKPETKSRESRETRELQEPEEQSEDSTSRKSRESRESEKSTDKPKKSEKPEKVSKKDDSDEDD